MQHSISPSASGKPPHFIQLSLNSRAQLFASSEPPPVGAWVLHPQISEYLMEQSSAIPGGAPLKLVLYLPAEEAALAGDSPAVVGAYFEACRLAEQRKLHQILRDGRLTLFIGLIFLIVVNGLGEAIKGAFERPMAVGVAHGLEIFGWVAMWRPAELLLYDWIPVRRKMNLMARLAAMDIECQAISSIRIRGQDS
jgi:hypothetical protein